MLLWRFVSPPVVVAASCHFELRGGGQADILDAVLLERVFDEAVRAAMKVLDGRKVSARDGAARHAEKVAQVQGKVRP